MGGITPDGPNYNCNHEFYDYSFEISDHREYNYYAYNIGIGKGNMPIDVYKIRITHCEPEDPYDEFEPHDITDWEESGELGDLLPAAPGCTYEIHFSNRYCMKKDEHYFCVPYSYEDVMNAPCALNGYIVNNHSK